MGLHVCIFDYVNNIFCCNYIFLISIFFVKYYQTCESLTTSLIHALQNGI